MLSKIKDERLTFESEFNNRCYIGKNLSRIITKIYSVFILKGMKISEDLIPEMCMKIHCMHSSNLFLLIRIKHKQDFLFYRSKSKAFTIE